MTRNQRSHPGSFRTTVARRLSTPPQRLRENLRPIWRQAAAGLLALSLCLAMPAACAAGAVATAPLASFAEETHPAGLVYGPAHSLWVSLPGTGEIGQVAGTTPSSHPLPDTTARPWDLAVGSDQALWFSIRDRSQILRLGPGAEFSEFPLGEGSEAAESLVLGQDLALWFTQPQANRIGRLTPQGAYTSFDLPDAGRKPVGIAAAQNGDLWFAEWDGYRIGKITLQGEISEYELPNRIARPVDLLVGPGGEVWVIFNTGRTIARFDPQSETFDLYPLPTQSPSLQDLTIGPDGRIWFIGTQTTGSFEVLNGAPANLAEEALPSPIYTYQGRSQIIAGPDNNLIFTTANTSTIYQFPLSAESAMRDLQIFITHHPPLLLSSGEFTIDAEIVNWTNTDASDVEITLSLDASIRFVRAELTGGSCIRQRLSVQCGLPTLGAGESQPVRFVMTTDYVIGGPHPRTLVMSVASAGGDYQPANNRVALFTTLYGSLDYDNNFSTGADGHWSLPVTNTPVEGLDVLGLFDNDQVIFNWEDLPPHDRAWVYFDLYVMGPWTGSQFMDQNTSTVIGPDLWTIYINDDFSSGSSRRLILTTFSNQDLYPQAFPEEYPDGSFPAQTAVFGAGDFDADHNVRDARYRFSYRLEHSSLSLNLLLKGLNLDGPAGEKWAIDNVHIKILYGASYERNYLPALFQ